MPLDMFMPMLHFQTAGIVRCTLLHRVVTVMNELMNAPISFVNYLQPHMQRMTAALDFGLDSHVPVTGTTRELGGNGHACKFLSCRTTISLMQCFSVIYV